jgi:uncharacterized repeat protein (TIGR01451 family)
MVKGVNRVSTIVLVVSFVFVVLGLIGSKVALAASSPDLGTAGTYSILSGTTVTNSGATTISGNVGISPAGGGGATGFGTVTLGGVLHDADAAAATAQSEMNAVYTTALNQTCTTDYGAIIKSLNGLTLAPGVYCADEFDLSGTLTLSGTSSDVWIFKSASSLVVSGGALAKVIFSGGGLPCNVWWRVVSTASLDAGSSLVGNILADTSVTLAAGATLDGRALARTASVTLVSNVISGPTCTVATPTPTSNANNTITIFKHVINDNGRTATYTDFPLFVNGNLVKSGESIRYQPGLYTVTETNSSNYLRTFSGDCNASGQINHGGIGTQNDVCIVTNDDIGAPVVVPPVPPLIDVIKVPSPLALPAGPGEVTYTYTLTNIGTVPVTDVKLLGDTCSPIVLVSGDTNNDKKLDLNETWVHTCSTTLAATHTNTVVATGWANGISANDVASATVIVGVPIVPPLIHVTKTPSAFTLPAEGGMITYTKKVTNPGTVALHNVQVTDDKCSSVNYISGDTNGDSLLNSNETWIYTCRTNITRTTVNTAVATGEANGLTARDFAIATVVVATAVPKPVVVPKLPNTGFPPVGQNIPWNAVVLVGVLALVSSSLMILKKHKN